MRPLVPEAVRPRETPRHFRPVVTVVPGIVPGGLDPRRVIDEILLSYVVAILESDIAEEGFDVSEFREMLSAYIPSFQHIRE